MMRFVHMVAMAFASMFAPHQSTPVAPPAPVVVAPPSAVVQASPVPTVAETPALPASEKDVPTVAPDTTTTTTVPPCTLAWTTYVAVTNPEQPGVSTPSPNSGWDQAACNELDAIVAGLPAGSSYGLVQGTVDPSTVAQSETATR
jgi:hypothetical protein